MFNGIEKLYIGNAKMVLSYTCTVIFLSFQHRYQQKKRERPLSHSRFPFSYKTIPTYGFGTMSP